MLGCLRTDSAMQLFAAAGLTLMEFLISNTGCTVLGQTRGCRDDVQHTAHSMYHAMQCSPHLLCTVGAESDSALA